MNTHRERHEQLLGDLFLAEKPAQWDLIRGPNPLVKEWHKTDNRFQHAAEGQHVSGPMALSSLDLSFENAIQNGTHGLFISQYR